MGIKTIADALHYAMALVTRMAAVLMDMKPPVRERYGKICLTGDEARELVRTITGNLPEN